MIPLLSLALILLTAQDAARLSWRLLDLVRPSQEKLIATTAAGPDGSETIVRPERATPDKELMNLHLFGQAGQTPGATDLPQTTLHLSLIGVIFNSSPEKAVAIIKEQGSTEEAGIYGVGDKLPGNSVIREILTNRVILDRAGNQEVLPLDEELPAPAAGITKENKPKTRGVKRGIQATPQPLRKPNGNGASVNIDRNDVNQRLSNLQSLGSQINAEAVEGDQKGYRLQAGSNSELLDQLGLKSGDILTEINGIPLRNAGDAMQAYAKLKDAEKVQVQFIREGVQQTIEYTVGDL